MPNTNVLEGVKCPKCGHTENFTITVKAWISVDATDDGYWFGESETLDEEWEAITCPVCGLNGTPSAFREEVPNEPN